MIMDHPATIQNTDARSVHRDNSTSKWSRIIRWLADTTPPISPSYQIHQCTPNTPDQLTGQAGLTFVHASCETLDDDEESDFTSDKESRTDLSPAVNDYIIILRDHNIHIDTYGHLVPSQLQKFLENEILSGTEKDLISPADFQLISRIRAESAQSNETLVSQLLWSPLFPQQPTGLAQEGETIWNMAALAYWSGFSCTLAASKSDFSVGYDSKHWASPFDTQQRKLMDRAALRPYAAPSGKHHFPFLVVKINPDPAGFFLTKAEYQAAACGSACVSGLRWFLNSAKEPEAPEAVEDPISFSVIVDRHLLSLHVHWYSSALSRFVTSHVTDYHILMIEDARRFASTISNIYKWAMGPRKEMIQSILRDVCQKPRGWMAANTRKRCAPYDQLLGNGCKRRPGVESDETRALRMELDGWRV